MCIAIDRVHQASPMASCLSTAPGPDVHCRLPGNVVSFVTEGRATGAVKELCNHLILNNENSELKE